MNEMSIPKKPKFSVPKRQTNREIAIQLAEAGVKVFPCYGEAIVDGRGQSKEKSPYVKWQDAPIGDVTWVNEQWDKWPTASRPACLL